MKIFCPGHYCVLELEDKQILANHQVPVEAVAYECPFCNEQLRILNILIENISCNTSATIDVR